MGVSCPECEYSLKLGTKIQDGRRVVCPNCRTALIINITDDDEIELLPVSNQSKKRPIEVGCPECEEPIRLNASVRLGQPITCQHCLAELEVVSVDPLEVDFATPIPLKKNRYKKAGKLSSKNRKFKD